MRAIGPGEAGCEVKITTANEVGDENETKQSWPRSRAVHLLFESLQRGQPSLVVLFFGGKCVLPFAKLALP